MMEVDLDVANVIKKLVKEHACSKAE